MCAPICKPSCRTDAERCSNASAELSCLSAVFSESRARLPARRLLPAALALKERDSRVRTLAFQPLRPGAAGGPRPGTTWHWVSQREPLRRLCLAGAHPKHENTSRHDTEAVQAGSYAHEPVRREFATRRLGCRCMRQGNRFRAGNTPLRRIRTENRDTHIKCRHVVTEIV